MKEASASGPSYASCSKRSLYNGLQPFVCSRAPRQARRLNREERMPALAFRGLGHRGGPRAANLVEAGHNVVGFDLAAASCDAAREAGVAIAGSVREAVTDAEAVVPMLPDGKHVLSVWSDILPSMNPSALANDCSTIDVES